MKALVKTLADIWQSDPNEPEHPLKRSDYVAMGVILIIVAVVAWYWPA